MLPDMDFINFLLDIYEIEGKLASSDSLVFGRIHLKVQVMFIFVLALFCKRDRDLLQIEICTINEVTPLYCII